MLFGGGYYIAKSNNPSFTVNTPNSGISGKAEVGPTCPVQKVGEICSQPYHGVIVVKNSDGSREVTRFTTKENGEFKINLPPGNYTLTGDQKTPRPFLKEVRVEIKSNEFTEVQLNFDTGIR